MWRVVNRDQPHVIDHIEAAGSLEEAVRFGREGLLPNPNECEGGAVAAAQAFDANADKMLA